MSKDTGIVFNIQRFTIHDGPGIRTEVFLKGCPLSCKWCSNPEGIHLKREVGVYPAKCLGQTPCGSCLEVCALGGAPLLFNPETGKIGAIDRDICIGCMKCTEVCFMHALKSWGISMTVEEVMEEVRADKNFYANSGGGLTISGGEVAVQWEFALELLKASRAEGIHTCTETSMQASPEIIRKLLEYSDMIITDIKHMDANKHREWCGVGNELILSNIEMVANETDIPLVLRIPIVPEVNDSEENIRATAEFIRDRLHNRVSQLQLLVYLKMGTEKYDSLGLDYPMPEGWEAAERAERDPWIEHLAEMLRDEYNIKAYSGAATIIEGYEVINN